MNEEFEKWYRDTMGTDDFRSWLFGAFRYGAKLSREFCANAADTELEDSGAGLRDAVSDAIAMTEAKFCCNVFEAGEIVRKLKERAQSEAERLTPNVELSAGERREEKL